MQTKLFAVWHCTTIQGAQIGYKKLCLAIARWHNNHEQFMQVAIVAAGSLEQVWDLTQNRNGFWIKRPEVQKCFGTKLRSTGIGDVFVADETAWLVVGKGWLQIPAEPLQFVTKASKIKQRGFASMSPKKRRMIAGRAGKKAHKLGKAHTYTREEARAAGKVGGTRRRERRMKEESFTAKKERA